MGKTQSVIANLPNKNRIWLDRMFEARHKAEDNNQASLLKEYNDMIRGYIKCLNDSGIVSDSDARALYIFYGTI